MFITSYGPLLNPSWIVGGILSHFIGNKKENGWEMLVNGKPMVPNFPHWKGEQVWSVLFTPSAEWSRKRCERRKKTNRETQAIPKKKLKQSVCIIISCVLASLLCNI